MYYLIKDRGGNMFENNNNNNGNFNQGGRPFFENTFNNSSLNNTMVPEPSANPSYQSPQNQVPSSFQSQGTYPYGFNNSNEVFGSGVNNGNSIINQNLVQQPETFNPNLTVPTTQMDIPPELGEIKSLNEATVASAPTMDVLDPMNVMKETVSPKDPLDNYENGTLGSFNNASVFPNSNFPFDNMPQVEGIPSASVNNIMNNNSFETPLPDQTQTFNPPFNQNNNIIMPNPANYESKSNNLSSQFENGPTMKNEGLNSLTNQFNSMVMPNENNNLSNSFDTGYQPNTTQDNMITSETKELNSSLNSVASKSFSFEQPTQTNTIITVDNEEHLLPMDQNNEYTIIQNDDLNKDDNISTLSNLGIENAYDEPDTLDILDINEDETDVKPKDEKTASVSEIVEKIKELLEELKVEGANVDLEEFDFEDMYELIIKINKEAI